MNLFSRLSTVVAALLVLSSASSADTILTVTVKKSDQDDRVIEYSMADMEAMEQYTLVTANEFIDGKQEFIGPLVRDILIAVGAGDVTLARVTAANDYFVEIPTEEFFRYDAVLALTMGGQPFSMRDKGPIWLMYPMSDHEELKDPVFNNRLIWQLVGMELE